MMLTPEDRDWVNSKEHGNSFTAWMYDNSDKEGMMECQNLSVISKLLKVPTGKLHAMIIEAEAELQAIVSEANAYGRVSDDEVSTVGDIGDKEDDYEQELIYHKE